MSNGSTTDRATVVIGTILIILVVCFAGFVIWIGIDAFMSASEEIKGTAMIAVVTVFGSLFTVVYSKRAEKTRDIKLQHRQQKEPIYERFSKMLFGMLNLDGSNTKLTSQAHVTKELTEFTRDLIVWGSDDVLKAYRNFRVAGAKSNTVNDQQSPELLYRLETVLLAIRKDLGHTNKGLKRGDVLRTFINDLPDATG